MPVVNDILLRETATIANFDPNDTGINHTWDYSQLTPTGQDGDTAIAVTDTPFLYQFFFNNAFIYPDHDADYAFPGDDFGAQGLTVSNVYEYFKVENAGFRNVGFGANINGLPSSIQRVPVDEVLVLPMNYGDNSSSFSSYEISVPLLLFFKEDQTRTNQVDGWGSLILPNGQSYDVLRVASTLDRMDSIYLDAAGFGFNIPLPQTIEYKWLANGEPEPLLVVTTVAGVATTVTYKVDAFTSVSEEQFTVLDIYPNPTAGNIIVSPSTDALKTYEVFDLHGKLVASTSRRGSFNWNLSELSGGEYFIKSGNSMSRLQVSKN